MSRRTSTFPAGIAVASPRFTAEHAPCHRRSHEDRSLPGTRVIEGACHDHREAPTDGGLDSDALLGSLGDGIRLQWVQRSRLAERQVVLAAACRRRRTSLATSTAGRTPSSRSASKIATVPPTLTRCASAGSLRRRGRRPCPRDGRRHRARPREPTVERPARSVMSISLRPGAAKDLVPGLDELTLQANRPTKPVAPVTKTLIGAIPQRGTGDGTSNGEPPSERAFRRARSASTIISIRLVEIDLRRPAEIDRARSRHPRGGRPRPGGRAPGRRRRTCS